ncbi:MAG: DUF4445 domain-containing protein [Clostridia bacterium]|nr:DUF4445 domain-containing protein [Clostridia bacterium]
MEIKITILPSGGQITAFCGERLLDALARAKYLIPASCGGKGTCGKCKVKLLRGKVDNAEVDKDGYILSCKALVKEDITIYLLNQLGSGLTQFEEIQMDGEKIGIGVALDIGTTTIGACLIDLKNGKTLKKISSLNPQAVYGADVLSRIKACSEGKLSLLQKLIIDETKRIILQLEPNEKISELYVGANTTMLHLFLGVDPTAIGVYPFTPAFTCERNFTGKELGLPVERVKLLPSASAYVGSDVTVGVLSCLNYGGNNTLFVDMGTNGEIALSYNGQIYATSTAAGPTLEGACIECGMGGVSGAIDKVFVKEGNLEFTTIDNALPIGICGSGLIDLITFLKKEQIIDETGAFDDLSSSRFLSQLKEDKFYITDDIYLSQKDIRQFQLAKSAISAGMETLLLENDVKIEEIDKVFVAGGLGYFMNVQNACEVGLLPKYLKDKAIAVGNSCLSGIKLCLLQQNQLYKVNEIAKSIKIIELSFSKVFQDKYVENMMFE